MCLNDLNLINVTKHAVLVRSPDSDRVSGSGS